MSFEPPVPPPTFTQPMRKRTNAMAIASVVAAGVGVVITIGIPSILAVVFGHIGLRQIKQTGEEGRTLAIVGLALGYTTLAIGIVIIGIAIAASGASASLD